MGIVVVGSTTVQFNPQNSGGSSGIDGWIGKAIDKKDSVRAFVLESFTVDEIIDHFRLDHVPFIKLDCEGCEYEVLPSLSPRSLTMFRSTYVAGEMHGSAGVPEKTVKLVKNISHKELKCASR